MTTWNVILFILLFGGGILAYCLVKEIKRIEKKYGEQFINGDI